ncbi:MAG TPA: metalloregulator ArsR/SmtB family transcription factor [Desulfuromonadales bacterium]|nr:metalloregulator ArsR/SmtB family transcription factor [Desulfuromonadales bacterium]
MQTEQSLFIMKALADKSRLAIVNSLLERSQYVEELAERHGLAPSTVSFHLRKLEQAGLISSRKEQYYVVVEANDALFDATLRQIVAAAPVARELQDRRIEEYRSKVLQAFFSHGRLEKLPAQHKKRLIVLEQFAKRFEPGCRYEEQEVTGLIAPLYDDYCTIRRLLVDEGMIQRDGATYWRQQATGAAKTTSTTPPKSGKGQGTMQKSERADIKRSYKQSAPPMGVYQILSKANGKIYVAASRNLEGERNSRLFQLKMGKIVFSRELQKDLERYGAGNFEFSVLAVLEPQEPGTSVERALADLELQWLEKLRPFGERGYNNVRAFKRNAERRQSQG